MSIEELLAELKRMDDQLTVAEAPWRKQLDELEQQVNFVVMEMHEATAGLRQHIAQKEEQIRLSTVQVGESTKLPGTKYQAVYVPPAEKWNKDLLNGYAIAHPEVKQCMTLGQPSAQIRRK